MNTVWSEPFLAFCSTDLFCFLVIPYSYLYLGEEVVSTGLYLRTLKEDYISLAVSENTADAVVLTSFYLIVNMVNLYLDYIRLDWIWLYCVKLDWLD